MIPTEKLKLAILLGLLPVLMSCSSKSGINSLYNTHKTDADLAMSMPRWLAMSVLPANVKRDIKPLIKGMKHIKMLYDEESEGYLLTDFKQLSSQPGYTSYATITKEEVHIDILALESESDIKELILYANDEEMTFLIGVTGKMNKDRFLHELGKVTAKNED